MKKLYFMFLVSLLIGCGNSNNNSSATNPITPIKKIIKGQAAVGSFLPVGAEVDIRPAPVNGVPCDLIVTQIADDQGNYAADVSNPKTTAGQSLESTQPAGYIIRVQAGGSWLYSYADNQSDAMVADVNPYTDIMIRVWYNSISREIHGGVPGIITEFTLETLFSTGMQEDKITAMDVPDSTTMSEVITSMNNIMIRVYNLPSMSNYINMQWAEGSPIDCLLYNSSYPHLQWFLNTEFWHLFQCPDVITDAAAIQTGPDGSPVQIDIWTPYGNTGNVTLLALTDDQGTVNPQTIMIKMSDSVEGNNHFQTTTIPLMQVSERCVMITIDDYAGGLFQLVIQTE